MRTITARRIQRTPGFTLVEILVSMAMLVVLMLILVSITESTRKTWTYTTGKIEQFREARAAFEAITRRLSQATLNNYWDYVYGNGATKQPTSYARQSELRFISGDTGTLSIATNRPTHAVFFQAPLGFVDNTATYSGLGNLLNIWGYCIEFGNDSTLRPPFLGAMPAPPALRNRFRLLELMQPSQSLALYSEEAAAAGGNSAYTAKTWFTTPLGVAGAASRPVRVLAENILALVLLPKLSPGDVDSTGTPYPPSSLAPTYFYDSTTSVADKNLNPKNQLPPVVQVTMVAVDETTYARFQSTSSAMPASLAFGSLFQQVGSVTDATVPGYAMDLATLQATLLANKLNYRVFTTEVSLKTAKWSREQKN